MTLMALQRRVVNTKCIVVVAVVAAATRDAAVVVVVGTDVTDAQQPKWRPRPILKVTRMSTMTGSVVNVSTDCAYCPHCHRHIRYHWSYCRHCCYLVYSYYRCRCHCH